MSGLKDDSISSTIKTFLLFLIICQNTSAVLLTRYTRTHYDYDLNSMFLVSEIMKLIVSLIIEAVTFGRETVNKNDDEESASFVGKQTKKKIGCYNALATSFRIHIWESPKNALQLTIPAFLYLLQNFLVYTCLSLIPVPLYQICQQAKLVTTALLSIVLFRRSYVCMQWISIFTLCLGTSICVLSHVDGDESSGSQHDTGSLMFGLMLVLLSNFTSSSAAVYTEAVMKGKGTEASKPIPSIWMRNIQLAFFTICILFVKMMSSKDKIPFFYDYSPILWLQIIIFALGGLLIAAVIKYTDSVQKGLATGLSVIFSSAIATVIEPDDNLSINFIFGTALAIGGCFFFANPNIKLKQIVNDYRGNNMSLKKIITILAVIISILYVMNRDELSNNKLPSNWKQQLHFQILGATSDEKLFELHESISELGIESTALENCPTPEEIQESVAANKTIVIVYSELVPTTCVGIGSRVHVRWILSSLYKQTYPLNLIFKEWGEEDLVFNYETALSPHPENVPLSNVLHVATFPKKGDEFDLPLDIIKQSDRNGTAWIMMEGKKHHDHIDYIHETEFPAPHIPFGAPTANDLLQFEYFVSYDPFSVYSFAAALSGAISIVYPVTGMSRREWVEKSYVGEYIKAIGGDVPGIAYGYDEKEIQFAKKTMPKLRSFLMKAQKWGKDVTVKRFIEDCFKYTEGVSLLKSGMLVRDSQFEL